MLQTIFFRLGEPILMILYFLKAGASRVVPFQFGLALTIVSMRKLFVLNLH